MIYLIARMKFLDLFAIIFPFKSFLFKNLCNLLFLLPLEIKRASWHPTPFFYFFLSFIQIYHETIIDFFWQNS